MRVKRKNICQRRQNMFRSKVEIMGLWGVMANKKGDGKAEITNADQQTAIVNTLLNWLAGL